MSDQKQTPRPENKTVTVGMIGIWSRLTGAEL